MLMKIVVEVIAVLVIIAGVAYLLAVRRRPQHPPMSTQVMVETALVVALAATLHILKLWQMPAGGTVSLEMLPILVIALRRGARVGVTAGVLFGVVDVVLEPFVVHWVQFLLDYPLAFAAVGLAGVWASGWHRAFRNNGSGTRTAWITAAAVVTGSAGRYVAHFVSGVVFFATTLGGGPLANGHSAFENPAALAAAAGYSAVYNLYVPLSAAACLAAMLFLMPVLERSVPSQETHETGSSTEMQA